MATASLGLTKALRIINEFRKLDGVMPTQTAELFLHIALSPGKSMVDYKNMMGVSQSTVSRNVAYLSDLHWKKKPGLAVVEVFTDPHDSRFKLMRLTAKGKRVASSIIDIID